MWRILLLCLLSLPALADEIRLANGDRISGEVKSRSGEHLVVQTEYAGELSIRLGDIESALLTDAQGVAHELGPGELGALDVRLYKSRAQVAYTGRTLLAATYTRGNTESDHAHLEADFTARAKAYRYNLSGRADRHSEGAAEDTAWLAGASYDRFLDERQFAYVRGSLEHDEAKDVDRRAAAGLGYGLQLVETAAANVSVRGGLDYVAVERIVGPREEYPAFGWGLKLGFSPWGPRLQLFHEQEGFWNLEDTDVVTLRSKTGLRLPLVERLGATAQVNVDWESEPVPGRKSTDSTLLLGLDYSF
jgi:putative salt-induced outer membrane protein YdiY